MKKQLNHVQNRVKRSVRPYRRLAIFLSGKGTNMENIVMCIEQGQIKAEVAVVVSDRPRAAGLLKARDHGIKTEYIDPKKFETREAYDGEIITLLKREKVDLVILAGYMRIVTEPLLEEYKGRILNIHPSLLPAFKGANGIRDAFDYGVKVTGVTVHFVTSELDGGPIILQRALEIKPKETLEALEERIHALEYEVYPEAINRVLRGKDTFHA